MSGPLVSARGVVRRFGSQVAVDRVDLDVRAEEIVGLLGANGAGKTTLIRMLLGLLRPDEGTVLLFGGPPSRETRRRLGYVPQGLGLWNDLTAAENLSFTARAFGMGAAAGALGADAELRAVADLPVQALPLGLRRRLAFAAALTHEPDLLVLDEPTSGVDPLARARLWDTVHAAVDGGCGALVTTHHMDETQQCDRVVVMADGRVVAAGRPSDITAGRSGRAACARRTGRPRSRRSTRPATPSRSSVGTCGCRAAMRRACRRCWTRAASPPRPQKSRRPLRRSSSSSRDRLPSPPPTTVAAGA